MGEFAVRSGAQQPLYSDSEFQGLHRQYGPWGQPTPVMSRGQNWFNGCSGSTSSLDHLGEIECSNHARSLCK